MSAKILLALFNGAWQGAALSLTATVVFRCLRNQNATTLFALWTSIWIVCLGLPVADFYLGAPPVTVYSAPAQKVAQASSWRADSVNVRALLSVQRRDQRVESPVRNTLAAVKRFGDVAVGAASSLASLWLAILAAIACVRLCFVGRDVLSMLSARKRLTRLEIPGGPPSTLRPIEFASSTEFSSPCVLGFWPAIVVIPESVLSRSSTELHGVVLHEIEHTKRFDDVQNVLARALTSVAFFCPGAFIAHRRIALYREQICDDAAILGCGETVSYAKSLAAIAEDIPFRGAPAPGLLSQRNDFLQRIRALLDSAANHSLNLNRRLYLTGAIAVTLSALCVLRFQVPGVAAVSSQPSVVSLQPTTFAGTFDVGICTDNTHQIMLSLEYHSYSPGSNHSDEVSRCASYSQFQGFEPFYLSATRVTRRTFDIVRDEGTMHATGMIGKGAGTGSWTFEPRVSFIADLRSRGVDAPTPIQQFEWMMSDFRLSTIDALRRGGFDQPNLQDLMMLSYVGNTDWLVGMAVGLPGPKRMADLVRAAQLGMTVDFVSGFNSLGYRLPLDQLIRLREADVRPSWVKQQIRKGSPLPSVDELIRDREQSN